MSSSLSLVSKLVGFFCIRQDRDLEIAVAGTQFIDEGLFFLRVLHLDLIGKTEHAAHAGGLYPDVLCLLQIAGEGIIEGSVVLQGFRNGDLQELVLGQALMLKDVDIAEQHEQYCHGKQDHHTVGDKSHTEGNAGTHGHQDGRDLIRGSLR